jgi:hypothetical protein
MIVIMDLPPSPAELTKPKNKLFTKKRLSIGVLLFVILIILGVVFYNQPKPPTQSKDGQPVVNNSISGLEIAKQTANFLDRSMLPNGDFTSIYACHKDLPPQEACRASSSQLEDYSKLNGFISLAYLNLFKKTQNIRYKENSEKAISYVLTQCQTNRTFCFNSLHGLYAWYKETNDPKYKDAMLLATDFLLARETLNQSVANERAMPLWMMYDVTQDARFKNKIESIAEGLLKDEINKSDLNYPFGTFYKEGDFEVKPYQILATNYYIAAYKTTQDSKYLKAAQDFFDKAKVQLHIEDFKKLNTTLDLSTLEYLLDLTDISEPSRQQTYLDQAQILAQPVLLSFWDNPVKRIYNGDSGFILNHKDNDDTDKKLAVHNGFRVNQFLRLGDRVFNLK